MSKAKHEGRRRLLFIGAGASYGARNAPRPPLGTELIGYLARCFPNFRAWKQDPQTCGGGGDEGEDARLEAFFEEQRDANQTYEKALNELMKVKDDDFRPLLFALNRLLAFSFSHGNAYQQRHPEFQPAPDRYDLLIQLLDIGPDSGWRIISLNYDTLFEEALERRGLKYVYPGLPQGVHPATGSWADAVPVYKVHGSCNWFVSVSSGVGYYYGKEGADPPPHDVDFFYDAGLVGTSFPGTHDVKTSEVHRRLSRPNQGLSRSGLKHPVMAHFCKYKPALHNYRTLFQIRNECLADLESIERAVVIGVRPVGPEDDTTVAEILARLPPAPRTEYVNPSEGDVLLAQESGGKFEFTRSTLEDWLVSSAPIRAV